MGAPPDSEFLSLQEALLGRYSLERELGRGGMGIVYLARDVRLDRLVALKLLPRRLADRHELKERFLREARTAAKLSHPHIVPIHAVDEVDGHVFFVMSYVEGQTLGQRVRERGPLPPSHATRVIREVAWALAYAHSQGVVHRDVKPDNILLEEGTGRALVMDFGIAMVATETSLTSAHDILGTAEFMSPEQAAGETVDARSDLYALGVVGHYMLSGQLPFQGSTAASTLAQHLTRPAPPLASVAPEVPAPLARALDRCLAKDPSERFADGEALAEVLDRTLEARRDVPVPLRVFIGQMMERFRGWGWFAFAVLWTIAPIVAAVRADEWFFAGVLVLSAVGMSLVPVGMLALMTRRLLRSGYGVQDLLRALEKDIARRREERTFEFGGRPTWLDRWAQRLTWGGLAGFAAGTLSLFVFDFSTTPLFVRQLGGLVMGGGLAVALGAGFIAAKRHEQRLHVPGERWLRFWKGRFGRWIFKLSGVGARRVPAADTSHRPTEMAIGMAAERLFDELPKELRRDFAELPDIVHMLEDHAKTMRRRLEELDEALAHADRSGPGEERKASAPPEAHRTGSDVVEQLQDARRRAGQRLGEIMGALERIRLQLLLMQAGSGSADNMTADLSAARALSSDVDRLVEAQVELDVLLGARRPAGLAHTPTPTPA